jgi:hypothetical protein
MIVVLQLVGLWPRENLEFSKLTLFHFSITGLVHLFILVFNALQILNTLIPRILLP